MYHGKVILSFTSSDLAVIKCMVCGTNLSSRNLPKDFSYWYTFTRHIYTRQFKFHSRAKTWNIHKNPFPKSLLSYKYFGSLKSKIFNTWRFFNNTKKCVNTKRVSAYFTKLLQRKNNFKCNKGHVIVNRRKLLLWRNIFIQILAFLLAM